MVTAKKFFLSKADSLHFSIFYSSGPREFGDHFYYMLSTELFLKVIPRSSFIFFFHLIQWPQDNNNIKKKHSIQQQKVKLHGILFTGTKGTSLSRDSNTIFESGRVTD